VRLRKTVRARIFRPTSKKRKALAHLWDSWKQALNLPRQYPLLRQETDLPSYYCRDLAWKVPYNSDAPVGLPKDAFDVQAGGAFAPWFISIPTPEGRVRLPLRMAPRHRRLLTEAEFADSRLVKHEEQFVVHLVVNREVRNPSIRSRAPVLAVDLGERVIATSVALVDGNIRAPRFHGKKVRGIRRHYAWLRSRLAERRLLSVIKRIRDTEHRKVDDVLHKIASSIVRQASELGALIAVGDLSGIRKRRSRGTRLNRIVHSMPFNRLTSLISYKAGAGVPVLLVREDYSSRECHVCHEWGARPSQGRFECVRCGEYNADLNAAVNIAQRALAYMAIAGAPRFEPERYAEPRQVRETGPSSSSQNRT
jgi:IS605 OrfB family transposase